MNTKEIIDHANESMKKEVITIMNNLPWNIRKKVLNMYCPVCGYNKHDCDCDIMRSYL